MRRKIIELKGITKAYDGETVLDHINLDIYDNEFVTLLGPSGCGKTTTLRIIAGFEQPDEGDVLFLGEDIASLPPYRRNVNTVFQRYALFPHLNVFENIAFPLRVKKVPGAEIEQKVTEMLRLVALPGFEKRSVTSLSGGQQQRVAIARGLAANPEIIYFDEPTSALDPELIGEVLNVMRHLAEEGMTMLVVTHEMGFARNVSNYVLFMDDRKVIEQAPSKEFFSNPREERTRSFISSILKKGES